MASNSTDPSTKEDDEYQAGYEDEEDDEQTIEEEEQLASDDEQNELDDLEADANMPLDELLKLYGPNASVMHAIPHRDNEPATSSDEDDDDEADRKNHQHRHQFHQLLHVNGQLLPDNDDDDDTDDSFEPEIIKSINVGDEYQAQVPLEAEFDPVNGRSDDREVPVDELLWSSALTANLNDEIDQYLRVIRTEFPTSDEEISLQTLLNNQMNTDVALVKFRQLPVKTIYSYGEWSSDETQTLEEGLREFGKNFFKIQVSKCPNRSVREVIHYYYQWKKSERYTVFMEEQQRLNAITSVTDMIEKLIEEQEQQLCTARNSPNSSISIVTIRQQETTTTTTTTTATSKRSFEQADDDAEPPSKKPSLNATNSPTATIV